MMKVSGEEKTVNKMQGGKSMQKLKNNSLDICPKNDCLILC